MVAGDRPVQHMSSAAAHMHLFSLSIVCDHGPRSSPRQTFDPFYSPVRFNFPTRIRPWSRCAREIVGVGGSGGILIRPLEKIKKKNSNQKNCKSLRKI